MTDQRPSRAHIHYNTQRGDYVKKLQVVARHEERMQSRSRDAITERLARLGLNPLPKPQHQQQQQQAEE
jgi:hypothetical protein